MQSLWRVACVRIPRFPIGAVWREERVLPAELNKSMYNTNSQTLPNPFVQPSLQNNVRNSSQTIAAHATHPPTSHHPLDTQLTLALPGHIPVMRPGKKGADDRAWPNPITGASRVAEKPGNFSTGANMPQPTTEITNVNNGRASSTRQPTNTRTNPTGNRNDVNPGDSHVEHLVSTPVHWDSSARALAEGETIRVVSAAAGRMGVRVGMSVPEARVYCATLEVREWDQRAITDAVMALTGQLLQCSPQVTAAFGAPGTWWIGASGFDNVGGEEALANQLLKLIRAWHPDARVAIADSCVAARAATWAPSRQTFTVIPVGGCCEYLAPAPLGLIPMTEELREALQSLGLRNAGALAALAPGDVERRWGAEGLNAWRLAHGDDPRRPGLVRTEAARSASAELASATDNMAPLLFLIRSALNRLVQQLLNDGRAAASVAITLSLDARPQHTITREIRPARPLARVAPLFDQCRALLEKWTLEAPVFAVTVSIPATAPLTADQGDLLVPSWRDAAATVDAVFVRLRAALETNGANDVVVHPTFGNAHRPELAGQWQPADALKLAELGSAQDLKRTRSADVAANDTSSQTIAVAETAASALHNSAALRLLEKPERVAVQAMDSTPRLVNWRERRLQFVTAIGPERLSGDWWRQDGFARDYWRCTVAGEGDLLMYRDATGWFMQGWYD